MPEELKRKQPNNGEGDQNLKTQEKGQAESAVLGEEDIKEAATDLAGEGTAKRARDMQRDRISKPQPGFPKP
jgi:hypothetical protein